MKPLVSIVIPCFNAEAYIGDAIGSALAQTYRPIEVIAIDDGSTDKSLNVIKSFDICWETGPNRGGCAARNRGVMMARGELVQFLDADDLLHPEKIACQVDAIKQTGSDVVYCDCEFIAEGQRLTLHVRDIDGHDPVVFMLGGTLPTPAPLHYRTNLLAVGGFTEGLACAQERDLHLRLACMGLRFAHVDRVLATVRKRTHSVSSDSIHVLDQHEAIAQRAMAMLIDSGAMSDSRARAFAGWIAADARMYLRHGLRARAQAYFKLAREFHPDGGLTLAYDTPARLLRSVIGPALTERLVEFKRKLVA